MRGEEEREGETPISREEHSSSSRRERERRAAGRERYRHRTDDSLLDMVVTLPTFHEDRSWLKALALRNTRRRRGRRRPV